MRVEQVHEAGTREVGAPSLGAPTCARLELDLPPVELDQVQQEIRPADDSRQQRDGSHEDQEPDHAPVPLSAAQSVVRRSGQRVRVTGVVRA
jgi:hypothetical protein